MAQRLVGWWLLTVAISVMPVIFNLAHRWLRHDVVSMSAILGHGDLFIVAVAIIATPLGLLIRTSRRGLSHFVTTVLAFLTAVFAAGAYADVTSGGVHDRHRVAVLSLAVLLWMLVVGSFCMAVVDVDD